MGKVEHQILSCVCQNLCGSKKDAFVLFTQGLPVLPLGLCMTLYHFVNTSKQYK